MLTVRLKPDTMYTCKATYTYKALAEDDVRQRLQVRTVAVGHRKGGANIKPPAVHNALMPRGSLSGLPVPTFRS